MAAKKPVFDEMTITVKKEEEPAPTATVDIFLPELPGGDAGVKVDQYEHVTIANEEKETCYKVRRGEHVSVPWQVFVVLKEKYPKL